MKVPGTEGQFVILNNHAPIVSSLAAGEVTIKTAGQVLTYAINGGFVEVINNEVSLLVTGVHTSEA